MEIKQFDELSTEEKKELYKFIVKTDLTYNKSYIAMCKIYESDTFNDGNSVFLLVNNGKIIGSAAVITKEISIVGEAFITDVYISSENVEVNLSFIMEKIMKYCNICSARSMKIGIRQSETYLIPYIEAIEFTHTYDAVIMKYNGDKNIELKQSTDVELKPLCILNSHKFMDIHNKAFKNSPNGATIDEVEVKDYIIEYANYQDLIGICFAEKNACGIYELSIDENVGWINTLGIEPRYQRKGFGSALLAKCIKKLYEQNSDEIKLLVITSNDIAVKMYKENDFKEEKIFSYWFEKTLSL